MRPGNARDNNFDLLRLGAAVAVLFSHCYPLTASGDDPLQRWSGHTGGELGVTVFFAISGYLITLSWLSDGDPGRFAARRGLRLLPGLAVATVLTTFVLGPLVTTLGPISYLTDPTPWLYALRTSLLLPIAGTLPGVFTDNPFPDAVNGSLWTLPVEALAYAMVLAGGLVGLLRARGGPAVAVALVVAAFLASTASPLDLSGLIPSGAADAGVPSALRLVAVFAGGMLMAIYRDRVPLSLLALPAGFGLWWLSRTTAVEPLVAALTMPYAVLALAFVHRVRVPLYERGGDASYGIYIYAFPVQQTVAHLLPGISPGGMLAIALPVTFLLGRASWRVVERPALTHKPGRPLAPVPP